MELGKLAKAKNAVNTANASLAAITAATLQQSLSKEMRVSEWSAPELSEAQKQYAALDAWIIHPIYAVLERQPTVGISLKAASPVGQAVSIYSQNIEVAHGTIILQPKQFDIIYDDDASAKPTSVNVTKTRAVVQIDKVLKPNYNLLYHKKTIQEVQAERATFPVLVSLSSLKTRHPKPPILSAPALPAEPPRFPGTLTLIHPPTSLAPEVMTDEGKDSDDELDEPDSESLYAEYFQSELIKLIVQIYADVFHEMHKVCHTISEKHSLCHAFATAFSDTMLIPDKRDKAKVEMYLKSISKS